MKAPLESYISSAWNIQIFLAQYLPLHMVPAFRKWQASTGAIIGGTTALRYFMRSDFPDKQLVLYVNHRRFNPLEFIKFSKHACCSYTGRILLDTIGDVSSYFSEQNWSYTDTDFVSAYQTLVGDRTDGSLYLDTAPPVVLTRPGPAFDWVSSRADNSSVVGAFKFTLEGSCNRYGEQCALILIVTKYSPLDLVLKSHSSECLIVYLIGCKISWC